MKGWVLAVSAQATASTKIGSELENFSVNEAYGGKDQIGLA